jgi:16S rRNA (uracil1498-N3)-methyltransferase
VNRARVGDVVHLTDGLGHYLDAELIGETGKLAQLRIDSIRTDTLELDGPQLVLACGVVKGKRFEDAIEKAVELGVHRIVPLLTAHAEVDPRQGKQSRWRTLLVTAMKQSGRSWLPQLDVPMDLPDYLSTSKGSALYYGLARSRTREATDSELLSPDRLFSGEHPPAGCDSIVWLVGPEGGWADHELELLRTRARAVRLGPYRLRTATAALAGLALLGPFRENHLGKDR